MMGTEISTVLAQSREILKLFDDLQVINSKEQVQKIVNSDIPGNDELRNNEICFYKVKQLVFDEDYPHREAFENVLSAMDNRSFNFVYVLTGTKQGIELCIGVVKNQNSFVSGTKLSAVKYGEIVKNVFAGNFNGSDLEKLKGNDLDKLIGSGVQKYKNAGVILGIPSVNGRDNGEKYDFQGIDRLVNSMLGLDWRLVIVCEPVSKQEIQENRNRIYELYNRLSVWGKKTVQHSENDSVGISFGENTSESRGESLGYNNLNSALNYNEEGTGTFILNALKIAL